MKQLKSSIKLMKYLAPVREGVRKGPHRSLCTKTRGEEALDLCFGKGCWAFCQGYNFHTKSMGLKGAFGTPWTRLLHCSVFNVLKCIWPRRKCQREEGII